ncbi:hypothetical protein ACHAPO_004776 [Fusarium lateritium]
MRNFITLAFTTTTSGHRRKTTTAAAAPTVSSGQASQPDQASLSSLQYSPPASTLRESGGAPAPADR